MIRYHDMESGPDSDLPEEVLAVLPTDPYEQLDVARKISAMASSSRLSVLKTESGKLRKTLTEKEQTIVSLQERVGDLERTLEETSAGLTLALDEQAKLATENNTLSDSVTKLTRDVAKLETFKRALLRSLEEHDEKLGGVEKLPGNQEASLGSSFSSSSSLTDAGWVQSREDDKLAEVGSSRVASSIHSSLQEDESYSEADVCKPGISPPFSTTSPHLTPQLTPSDSPKKQLSASSTRQRSATSSPKQSTVGSPQQQSVHNVRASFYSSHPTTMQTTAPNSPPEGLSPARTPRMDGKDFFRQARNRLSYEQFSAFLSNIKELNAHRQTREEALRKADEIFGAENKDLYISFDRLLSRVPLVQA